MTDAAAGRDRAEDWASLADLIVLIAREVAYGDSGADVLPLSRSEAIVLRFVLTDPGQTAGRIAEATGLQRTNLSPVLRALERRGLIERRACPDDARAVRVRMTDKGRADYARIRRERAAAMAAAVGDARDLDAALALLSAAHDGLVRRRRG